MCCGECRGVRGFVGNGGCRGVVDRLRRAGSVVKWEYERRSVAEKWVIADWRDDEGVCTLGRQGSV